MNFLGITYESLKDPDRKKKGKKDKRGRPGNLQRIKSVGVKLVASGQYPTIDATFSPATQ